MKKCKIIIVKRTINKELIAKYFNPDFCRDFGLCELFSEGDEFLVDDPNIIPPGFCAWAWHDIHRELVTLMSGGNLDWMKKDGTAITCCTDGFRPVIFKLERTEEEAELGE